MWTSILTIMTVLAAAGPAPRGRVAVLMDDPAPGEPTRGALEAALQSAGYEVVARDLALGIRQVVTPADVIAGRLPEELSVMEADAILAGQAAYGPPSPIGAGADRVDSVHVSLTARLLDLAVGRVSTTQQTTGVGIGAPGADLALRGATKAVEVLFQKAELRRALDGLGQDAGSIILVVQGLPTRAALGTLRGGLERSLAGAPVREIYFAQGVGKLRLGDSEHKAMNGPDVADLLAAHGELALDVAEVANSRIVATYDRARSVSAHALVIEPTARGASAKAREELGRFIAGELSKFGFVRSSYQPSPLTRKRALARAKEARAEVVVETEIMSSKGAEALAIRVVDVRSGQVVVREQKPMAPGASRFAVASDLLSVMKAQLPDRLIALREQGNVSEPAVAGAMK